MPLCRSPYGLLLYAKPETNFTSSIRHIRNETATGAEIRAAVVSGIVSRDVPVSHWAVLSL